MSYEIVIRLTVPDGTTVRFEDDARPAEGYVPPFADEMIPLPAAAIPLPGDVQPFRTVAQPMSGVCPVHRVPWKLVPAGVSKKSGKPYGAFQACPERGCDQRPAA